MCIFHAAVPGARRKGGILYVHPFAEEMNKSRRMASLQAAAFANAGFDVLLLDLYGCGDSTGDFGDATWTRWQDDVDAGAGWLAGRGDGPVWLWGLRVGATLAAAAATRSGRPHPLLLWQPTVSGHRFVQQFFRSRVMSDAMSGTKDRSTTDGLLATLVEGTAIEVAGYHLSPDLILPLDAASLPTPPADTLVRWMDVADADASGPNAATNTVIAAWQDAGVDVIWSGVQCPPFWQTQDICECMPLILASNALIAR